MPRWTDVEDLSLRSAWIEQVNREGSPYLIRFAEIAKVVADLEPQRTRPEKAQYRVRTGKLDTIICAQGHEAAFHSKRD